MGKMQLCDVELDAIEYLSYRERAAKPFLLVSQPCIFGIWGGRFSSPLILLSIYHAVPSFDALCLRVCIIRLLIRAAWPECEGFFSPLSLLHLAV